MLTGMEIGLTGAREHGRVALAEALIRALSARGLAENVDAGWIDRTAREHPCGVPYVPFVEWQVPDCRYWLVDLPSSAPYLTAGIGESDAVVLVAGLPVELAHASVAVTRLIAAPRVIVFLNVTAGDAHDAERQVRELLTAYGVAGATVPVVQVLAGDASSMAGAGELLDLIHAQVPASALVPHGAEPVLIRVKEVFDGTVAAGSVFRGEIGVGEPVEVIGQGSAS